jgi:hypothetical protein
MPAPSVLFDQPLCAEVMGAGFQKLLGSEVGLCALSGGCGGLEVVRSDLEYGR